MPKLKTSIYKTKDLAEASMLIVKKQHLLKLEWNNQICWFVFDNKESCKQLSNDYYFSKVMVNAKTFQEVISRLKNRIFAEK